MSELGGGAMELNIMEDLLRAEEDEEMPSVADLDNLIYLNQDEKPELHGGGDASTDPLVQLHLAEFTPDPRYDTNLDDVRVDVTDARARIRIKVGGEQKLSISMDRMADIAVDAILAELRKEAV
jgi:hypothetical protein